MKVTIDLEQSVVEAILKSRDDRKSQAKTFLARVVEEEIKPEKKIDSEIKYIMQEYLKEKAYL